MTSVFPFCDNYLRILSVKLNISAPTGRNFLLLEEIIRRLHVLPYPKNSGEYSRKKCQFSEFQEKKFMIIFCLVFTRKMLVK